MAFGLKRFYEDGLNYLTKIKDKEVVNGIKELNQYEKMIKKPIEIKMDLYFETLNN